MMAAVKDIEKKYGELLPNTYNKVPYEIQQLYPIAFNITLFTLIKKTINKKKTIQSELFYIKNEINYIIKKYYNSMGAREKNRIHFLLSSKESLKKDLKQVKNAYAYIDEILTKESNTAEYYKNNFMKICFI
jgi:hypothetical protein